MCVYVYVADLARMAEGFDPNDALQGPVGDLIEQMEDFGRRVDPDREASDTPQDPLVRERPSDMEAHSLVGARNEAHRHHLSTAADHSGGISTGLLNTVVRARDQSAREHDDREYRRELERRVNFLREIAWPEKWISGMGILR